MIAIAEVKGMMAANQEHPGTYDKNAAVHFGDMRG